MGKSDRYQYLLGFLNILIFLVGAVFVVVGALFKFTSGILESDVITLFNQIRYEGLQLGLVGEGLAYLMMCFGGLIIFLAVLGACGAFHMNKCCLYTFAGFLVFVIVIELLIVGFWVFYRLRTDQWLRGRMLNLLKRYEGPQQSDTYSKGWNKLFMKGQCCGVNDQFKDGGTNSDFTELPTAWTSVTDRVPATCCQGVTDDTISSYINSADCTNTPSNFYTQGCYDRVADTVEVYSLIIFITSGIALLLEIAAIVLAVLVVKQSKNKIESLASTPTSKPPPYVSGNSANARTNWSTIGQAIKRNNFMDRRK